MTLTAQLETAKAELAQALTWSAANPMRETVLSAASAAIRRLEPLLEWERSRAAVEASRAAAAAAYAALPWYRRILCSNPSR